jgi:FlaA1/EpsC-like NDP-sugar epimerase
MFTLDNSKILKIIGRENYLFINDFIEYDVPTLIRNASFLVIGGAGSIGAATVKEIFKHHPKVLHVIDINENNLAELVRDIRSSIGYIEGDFKTYVIDTGSDIFEKFIEEQCSYDYILNFSALKHVRSEKDIYTLMRMIEVNILNVIKTLKKASSKGVKRYFTVSTDKSTNPVNMMGASKRIMEISLLMFKDKIKINTSRFPNVAFSDGSLLCSFINRILKGQPLVFPKDVMRYFISPYEASLLCLISCTTGQNAELFIPKIEQRLPLTSFAEIAEKFLNHLGFELYICNSEEEARNLAPTLPAKGKWACYISQTDTTGEKEQEEFYTDSDLIDWTRYKDIGVTELSFKGNQELLEKFLSELERMRKRKEWTKSELVNLFKEILPEFNHFETYRYLDDKM